MAKILKNAVGWQPDHPDHRDLYLELDVPKSWKAPQSVDLTADCPPVYDQKNQGCCVGHAVAGVIHFTEKEETGSKRMRPAPAYIYALARKMQGTLNQDSGTQIRTGFKAVGQFGYVLEKDMPYNDAVFNQMPSQAALDEGAKHKCLANKMYMRVGQTQGEIMAAVAAVNPVVFGFSVYQNFMTDTGKTGVCPMPKGSMVGGHAVMVVGYDQKYVIVRNSWGARWGNKGYFKMPWDYILNNNLADDLWTLVATPADFEK